MSQIQHAAGDEAELAPPNGRTLPGMLFKPAGPQHDADCRRLGGDRVRVLGEWEIGGPCGAPEGWLPDLEDAATRRLLDGAR